MKEFVKLDYIPGGQAAMNYLGEKGLLEKIPESLLLMLVQNSVPFVGEEPENRRKSILASR